MAICSGFIFQLKIIKKIKSNSTSSGSKNTTLYFKEDFGLMLRAGYQEKIGNQLAKKSSITDN